MKNVLAMVAVAGLSAAASADFNTGIGAGPFDSNGAVGAAVNGVFSFTYTGSSAAVYNSIRIRGTATSGNNGSFLSELRYRFAGPSNRDSGQLLPGGTWTGGVAVDNTQSFASFSMTNGTSYSFRFWESFNDGGDAGVDARWTDVQFDFIRVPPPPPPPCIMVGTYTAGLFDINTFTSNYDTELGLYDADGVLLASNDDAGGGLQSQIGPTLANGTYYLAVGGFNSVFAGGFAATGGNAAGNMNLFINGYQVVGDHTAVPSEIAWYCFEVVPAPGTLALAGMAGLVGLRRRR